VLSLYHISQQSTVHVICGVCLPEWFNPCFGSMFGYKSLNIKASDMTCTRVYYTVVNEQSMFVNYGQNDNVEFYLRKSNGGLKS